MAKQGMTIDTDLSQDLLKSPTGNSPTTPHSAADAQRAMTSTDSWKPSFNRRQSWDQQEYKHHLQMTTAHTGAEDKQGRGFTERS
ncbi:hypothetical protein QBC46DRAFT_377686 [Diplogelasinospora grovesii]|uniref:Uncharacterized protein n=1 Tax=Diplogelasinospora grovesii TaxID=303347 RepID=A0AAN6NDD0_9PEZI|nr:hypothetical protein QBC46DRAFT_377686 [Diplogelasinospora grovesii]